LTKDSDVEVGVAAAHGLARSPRTPLNVLQDLARHARDDIRACVARNPVTPRSLLEELLKNDSSVVWTAAFRVLAVQNPPPEKLLVERLRAAAPVEKRFLSQEQDLPKWVHKYL
jgi:hypothetical protein